MEAKEHGSDTENELRGKNTVTADSEGPAVRRLAPSELVELRQDMAESSAWAKAELKRRRAEKNQKKSEYGMGNGIKSE